MPDAQAAPRRRTKLRVILVDSSIWIDHLRGSW
jgi:hypothetical protein